jgi:hypothetical protein
MCIGVATKEFPSSDKHLGMDDYSCGYSGKGGVIRTKDVKLFTEPLRVGKYLGRYTIRPHFIVGSKIIEDLLICQS